MGLKNLRKKSKQNLKLVGKIIKIRAEINEIEMKKTIEKINEAKSWFFELINKIDKPLARLKEKRRGFRSIKIKDKKEEITSATTEI